MMMNKDKTILIAGDSWACGEWQRTADDYDISHGGLADYLIDENYNVINLGQPGGGNIMATTRIDNFLATNKSIKISSIIVFQTEWTRSIVTPEDAKLGYVHSQNKLMFKFYYQLSTSSQKFNVPVYIIGGCSDTMWIDQFSVKYPGVSIVCQSLTNLLLHNDHRITNPVYSTITGHPQSADLIELLKKYVDLGDLKLLLDDVDRGDKRLQLWAKYKKFFWPDGCHPNRYAHKILFDFLKEQNIFR